MKIKLLPIAALLPGALFAYEVNKDIESETIRGDGGESLVFHGNYAASDIEVSGSFTHVSVGAGYSVNNGSFDSLLINASNESGFQIGGGRGTAHVSGTSFEDMQISVSANSLGNIYGLSINSSVLENVDFSGTAISVENSSFLSMVAGISIRNAQISGADFTNLKIEASGTGVCGVYIEMLRNDSNSINSLDFRGSTFNGESFGASDIRVSLIRSGSSSSVLKNIMLGDGTIYSADFTGAEAQWGAVEDFAQNGGLILDAGESFVVDGGSSGVSAKLSVDSTLHGGSIGLENGGILEIADNTSLTFAKDSGVTIMLGSDGIGSFEDYMKLGANSTIVMEGYDSPDDIKNAFLDMFQDMNGSRPDWDVILDENWHIVGVAVPEPMAVAAFFSALALVFAHLCKWYR